MNLDMRLASLFFGEWRGGDESLSRRTQKTTKRNMKETRMKEKKEMKKKTLFKKASWLGLMMVLSVVLGEACAVKAEREMKPGVMLKPLSADQVAAKQEKKRWEALSVEERALRRKNAKEIVFDLVWKGYGYLTEVEREQLFEVLRKARNSRDARLERRGDYTDNILSGELKKEMEDLLFWFSWEENNTLTSQEESVVHAEIGTLVMRGLGRRERAIKQGGVD